MTYCPDTISESLQKQKQLKEKAARDAEAEQANAKDESLIDKFLGFFGIGAKQTEIRENVKQRKIEKLKRSIASKPSRGGSFEEVKYKDSLSTNSSIPPHNRPRHLLLNGIDLNLGTSFAEKSARLNSDDSETIIEGHRLETDNRNGLLNFTKSSAARVEHANSYQATPRGKISRAYAQGEHDEDELECNDNFMQRRDSDSFEEEEEDYKAGMFSQLGQGNPFEERNHK